MRLPLFAAILGALTLAASATAAPAPPTYAVRVYELFQDGPRLVLQERTTRGLEPKDVRNLAPDTTWPPADQPPLLVLRERDHVAFFASYWREDGANDAGKMQVAVEEDAAAREPGIAGVRVRVEPRTARPASPALVAAPVADSAAYEVRLYEVLLRGGRVVLEERTSRQFGAGHLRGVTRGEVVPPAGSPALQVWKGRDTLGFFGAASRIDGAREPATWDVKVAEEAGEAEMGATLVRIQVGEARERGPQPARRVLHPQRDKKQRADAN